MPQKSQESKQKEMNIECPETVQIERCVKPNNGLEICSDISVNYDTKDGNQSEDTDSAEKKKGQGSRPVVKGRNDKEYNKV